MTARLLVAGGAGFVGSAFVRHVLDVEPDAHVTVFDAFTYAGHRANLEGVDAARCGVIEGDVADARSVADAFASVRPTEVVNLAAETHVDRSLEDPQRFVRTNALGVQVLLDAARAARVRMLQVSTDEVYGSIPAPGAARGDAPLAPSSPYAASKAAGDLLCRAAHATHGQDVVVTRCTNNYGPRQMPEKLVALMTTRALSGASLPLYGDGEHVRDWLHVDDHAAGLYAALRDAERGSVHHFAGRTHRTNRDVVAAILAATGAPETLVVRVADRPGHDRRYALDDEATRRALSWSPRRAFDDGLRATVEWYRAAGAWLEAVTGADHRAFVRRRYGPT